MHENKKRRLEAFSDGVMAIAITLLAIELRVPHLVSTTLAGSFQELIPLLPNVFTFVLSFLAIAIFWVNHHQLTEHLVAVSRRIVWANMLFLLFQSLIPFATLVVSENPKNILSVITYSVILFGGSASFAILRSFIHQSHTIRSAGARTFVGPIVYALAIAAAPLSVWLSYFLLIIPPLYYFLPKNSPN